MLGSSDGGLQAPFTPPSAAGDWPLESLGDGQPLWTATMGYEQLLSIQQAQHRLELEHRDAEVARLKALLDIAEAQRAPGAGTSMPEGMAEILRMQEEETTTLMAAKHKEMELLVGILQLREQQIEDFRQHCEAQRLELQQLRRRRPGAEGGGPGTEAGGHVDSLGSSLETLRTPEVAGAVGGVAASGQHLGGASPPTPATDEQPLAAGNKDEHQQLQREVRRLRLRMEELEAATGEQHDRTAGLERELDARAEHVKALEEQVRVLRSPAWDDPQFQSFRSPAGAWPGPFRSPDGTDTPAASTLPGGELSPGFGTEVAAATNGPMGSVQSVHVVSETVEDHRTYVVNGISSVEDMDQTRVLGPYVHGVGTALVGQQHHSHHEAPQHHSHEGHQPHGPHAHHAEHPRGLHHGHGHVHRHHEHHEAVHDQHRPQQLRKTGNSHGHAVRTFPVTNGEGASEHAPVPGNFGASPPSLALPPLQAGQGPPRHIPGEEAAAALRASTPPPAPLAAGSATTAEEAQAAEAAAAYLLARSADQRVAAEIEAAAVVVTSVPGSPRPASPRHHSPRLASQHAHVNHERGHDGGHGHAHAREHSAHHAHGHAHHNGHHAQHAHHGHGDGHQPQPRAEQPTAAVGGGGLDAMALRRFGEEGHRPKETPVAPIVVTSEIDLNQSHLSISGQSQVQSYHSAVRIDHVEADVGATPVRSVLGTSWNAGASDAAETTRQSQELLREMRRLRLQMSELERVAGGRNAASTGQVGRGAGRQRGGADRLGASTSSIGADSDGAPPGEPSSGGETLGLSGTGGARGPAASPGRRHATAPTAAASTSAGDISMGRFTPVSGSGASSSAVRSARSEQPSGAEFAGWEYRPHASGDPVDAAVATLVNRPGRYRGWRALLCRLEQGIYLCGTRRVHLRADLTEEKIEASDDSGATWSDLETLMKGAEASQRALLERARDAAGLTT